MKILRIAVLCVLAAVTLRAADESFERRIVSELRAMNPAAVAPFEQANAARAKGDHAHASALYQQVMGLAPKFDHAMRRAASEEISMGHKVASLALARQAYSTTASPENAATLAYVLSTGIGRAQPTPGELKEAAKLAREAVEGAPDDKFAASAMCQVAVVKNDIGLLRDGTARMERLAPNDFTTPLFRGICLAADGESKKALASLERSKALGLPESEYERWEKIFRKAQPMWRRMLLPASLLIVALMLALFLFGKRRAPSTGGN